MDIEIGQCTAEYGISSDNRPLSTVDYRNTLVQWCQERQIEITLPGHIVHDIDMMERAYVEVLNHVSVRNTVDLRQVYPEHHTDHMRCNHCQSSDVTYTLRATRSADEGMVAFYCCRTCNSSWSCR